ncbi:MAG: bacillithiol biosynthesis BshC, partial [Myxococcales bacterium]|nr:bacillithiol biosynthesis BshC [Myxococcales bacterium]
MNPASFTPAWLVDDPAAVALLPRAYAAPDQRALAVRRAAARRIEPAVLAALGKRAASPAAKAHLEALAAIGAACVVTGQQAGLFGGPLYCIYKTAAAIINARALTAETGVPCVPVFWVQSEDHYFPEVAAAHALDARGQLVRVAWAEDTEDRRRSIGHRRYGAGVDVALAGLLNALGHGSAVDAVAARLRAHYRAGVGPATAF